MLRDPNFDDLALQPHDDATYTNQFTEFLKNNTNEEEKVEVKKKETKTTKKLKR